eukprot:TRINITY_DN351_c0_g1_i1.p1 TRINITY_DN351_c0_g1~~TRINITY_DN351_c0_g1_i1.p1  ORF type:complete len:232 (-),score=55.36 TRINITY_DN351_c0_g1_i1:26-721(-)
MSNNCKRDDEGKPEQESKGEKISRRQKELEAEYGVGESNQAVHPDGRQYDSNLPERAAIRKIAISESLTGGKLADLFCSHCNAGAFFIGCVCVYTLQHKAKVLGVDPEHADQVDCVSPQVCYEMAKGVLELFGDGPEVGLGVTGFAETEGVKDLEPHAYYCVLTRDGEKRIGRVGDGLKGKSRNEVRAIVAERVYLEACKVIGLKPDPDVAARHEGSTLEDHTRKKIRTDM